ncbi:hypothetical protein ACQP3J_31275, partial [Escherichia coli]
SQTHCVPDSKLSWHESRVAKTGAYKQMTTLQRKSLHCCSESGLNRSVLIDIILEKKKNEMF